MCQARPSRSLVFVAVLDAAENIALHLHLFGALDESLLALPINSVDVFLHGAEFDFLWICPNFDTNWWQTTMFGNDLLIIDHIWDGFVLPTLSDDGCMT